MKSFLIFFLIFGVSLQAIACKTIPTPEYYERVGEILKAKIKDYPRFKKYKIARVEGMYLLVKLHYKERKCKRLWFESRASYPGSCDLKYIVTSIESCTRGETIDF